MLRGRKSPSTPIASQAAIAAMTRFSAVATTTCRARRRASLDAHAGRRTRIGCQKKDAGTVARGGKHHAFGNAEFHLARREVRDHRCEAADQVLGLVRRLDACENGAVAILPNVERQFQELVRAV